MEGGGWKTEGGGGGGPFVCVAPLRVPRHRLVCARPDVRQPAACGVPAAAPAPAAAVGGEPPAALAA